VAASGQGGRRARVSGQTAGGKESGQTAGGKASGQTAGRQGERTETDKTEVHGWERHREDEDEYVSKARKTGKQTNRQRHR
jgi:hypothetical protein